MGLKEEIDWESLGFKVVGENLYFHRSEEWEKKERDMMRLMYTSLPSSTISTRYSSNIENDKGVLTKVVISPPIDGRRIYYIPTWRIVSSNRVERSSYVGRTPEVEIFYVGGYLKTVYRRITR